MSDLIQLRPDSPANRELEANVKPKDWVNPTPAQRYNLVVIGAGTAGLVAAAGAAGLGAKVALIERELMGGDCLNVGCVPSKGLLSAAHRYGDVRDAEELGVLTSGDSQVDFGAVMDRMRRIRADISQHDSVQRFSSLGIDVFLGEGRFVGKDCISVGDARLRFRKALIATGGRAAAPPIPGLEDVEYLTNESVFSLTELPPRLGVIGAGPIGCELAQSFARFGSKVTLVEALHGVLPKEEVDAGEIVRASLEKDGVDVLCCGKEMRVARDGAGVRMTLGSHDHTYDVTVDRLLVAVGRAPNVESLDLGAAGVRVHDKGVEVNDRLQTTNPRIFAAGDVCSPYQFTHAADFMARIVIQNALFMGRAKASALTIPWCTYTSPEVAHVGLDPEQAGEVEFDTWTQPLSGIDRAMLEGETDGYVRAYTKPGTDKLLGATVVAANAGDMIGHFSFAMTHGLGLKALGATIHPYPTQAEAIRKLGDQFNRTRLTPRIKTLFDTWMRWTR